MNNYDNNQMLPVKKWHSNMTYVAEGCGDLPVMKLDDRIVSIWKVKSIWERFKFMFHGEVTFSVWSGQQPPISINCGDVVERVKQ